MTHADTGAKPAQKPPAPDEDMLTMREAVDHTGLSRSTLEKCIRDKKLTPYRRPATPQERRFKLEELDALLKYEPTSD